jgi:hypothetical protein
MFDFRLVLLEDAAFKMNPAANSPKTMKISASTVIQTPLKMFRLSGQKFLHVVDMPMKFPPVSRK